jgi:hypothetical protein
MEVRVEECEQRSFLLSSIAHGVPSGQLASGWLDGSVACLA